MLRCDTYCSECGIWLHVDEKAGEVIDSKDLITDLYTDGPLLTWECPACGYADSIDRDD